MTATLLEDLDKLKKAYEQVMLELKKLCQEIHELENFLDTTTPHHSEYELIETAPFLVNNNSLTHTSMSLDLKNKVYFD